MFFSYCFISSLRTFHIHHLVFSSLVHVAQLLRYYFPAFISESQVFQYYSKVTLYIPLLPCSFRLPFTSITSYTFVPVLFFVLFLTCNFSYHIIFLLFFSGLKSTSVTQKASFNAYRQRTKISAFHFPVMARLAATLKTTSRWIKR